MSCNRKNTSDLSHEKIEHDDNTEQFAKYSKI